MIKLLKRKLGIDILESKVKVALSEIEAVSKRASDTLRINEANFGFKNVQEDLSELDKKLSERLESLESQMISSDGTKVYQKTFRDKETGESVVQKIVEQRTKI